MRKFLLLFLLLAPAALAHEFWLAPTAYRAPVDTPTPLRLLVGENFTGQPWGRPARKVLRLVRYGPAAGDSTDLRPALLADSGAAPTPVRCPTAGTHLVLLTSRLAFIELPAREFTAYLKSEGLDYALRERQQRGDSLRPGREAYARVAKTLLFAEGPGGPAPATDTAYRRVSGAALEIVPEQNPYRLRPGAALTVRVLRRGRPAPGVRVQLWNGAPPDPKTPAQYAPPRHLKTRTNAQGRALLRLPAGGGPWLVAAVGIEPAPAALRPRADWLSTWASLTFGPADPGPARRP